MPKIVIDIDDSLYDAIQTEFYVNGMRSGKTLLEKLTTTIRNGISLDDIKAEIDSQKFKGYPKENGDYYLPDHQAHFNSGVMCALNIINEHIGKRSNNEIDS